MNSFDKSIDGTYDLVKKKLSNTDKNLLNFTILINVLYTKVWLDFV